MNANDQKRYDAFKDEYFDLVEKYFPDETLIEPIGVHAQLLGLMIATVEPSVASRDAVVQMANFYTNQALIQVSNPLIAPNNIAAEDGSK